MKILQTSDWHIDWMTHGVRRFPELKAAVEATVVAAIKQDVDLYAFTGDLCDPDSGSCVFECIELACVTARCLQRHGIPSVWLSGNHDVIEDGQGRTTIAPLCALRETMGDREAGVYVFESGTAQPVPLMKKQPWGTRYVEVLALPYPSATKPYAFEDVFAKHEAPMPALLGGEPLIVLSHLTVEGVQPGEEVGEMARGRDVLYPVERVLKLIANQGAGVMLQGHYHRQQSLNYGGIYMHIAGSLARLTFGEEFHHPGFLIIEVK